MSSTTHARNCSYQSNPYSKGKNCQLSNVAKSSCQWTPNIEIFIIVKRDLDDTKTFSVTCIGVKSTFPDYCNNVFSKFFLS